MNITKEVIESLVMAIKIFLVIVAILTGTTVFMVGVQVLYSVVESLIKDRWYEGVIGFLFVIIGFFSFDYFADVYKELKTKNK